MLQQTNCQRRNDCALVNSPRCWGECPRYVSPDRAEPICPREGDLELSMRPAGEDDSGRPIYGYED